MTELIVSTALFVQEVFIYMVIKELSIESIKHSLFFEFNLVSCGIFM